ncbi:MAG TPA: DUF4350 domain-containing protein [Elainellaceae cyanobacterium]
MNQLTEVTQLKAWKNWGIVAIALGSLLLLTVIAAPQNPRLSGSTYSHAPSGYGAWYEFMEQQGVSMQRWEQPFSELPDATTETSSGASSGTGGMTLLRVNSGLVSRELSPDQRHWVEQGNRLIMLGVQAPVTEADFTTAQPSEVGAVKIETTRRYIASSTQHTQILGDRFGDIVWQRSLDQGTLIVATTPHLAANAYQDEPGNFKFLAQLVEGNQSIWVDEYVHGYRASEAVSAGASDSPQSWLGYLVQTPLMPAIIQVVIIILVLIVGMNRRFGMPASLSSPSQNNSRAYIQALAAVLQKAESSIFVIDIIGRHEQLRIQQVLGLGKTLVNSQTLLAAWTHQTGHAASDIEYVLTPYWQKKRLSETDLIAWMKRIQTLHQHLRHLNPSL